MIVRLHKLYFVYIFMQLFVMIKSKNKGEIRLFQWILRRIKKNNKGFTLVELVVVIAILGILAAIAVPKLGASRRRAAITAHNVNVRTLMSAATMYIADDWDGEEVEWTAAGGTKADNQGWAPYLQEWPKVPKGIEDKDGGEIKGEYKVKIDTEGNITVTPEEKESNNE